MEFEDYIKEVKKVKGGKKHKVTNSYKLRNAFRYYRSIRPQQHKYVLTEIQFGRIIRLINNALRESIIEGNDIKLPHKMGRIEVRKYKNNIKFVDGKLKTNHPINWHETLKLWYENPICRQKKQVVRFENPETYMIYYNKRNAIFNNKHFYEFNANRDIKIGLKNNIKLNKIEAFTK